MKNTISFTVYGRYALFTDPATKTGGEKFSYQVPTYEAIKGILKSIYWKPTLIWHVDRLRVMKPIQTQTKGVKPLIWSGGKGNSLANYTFLKDVEYRVEAHFEWNLHRPELAQDRIDGKHFNIAQRMLERGGRQDIFLGTRDCQAYVEPCSFDAETGTYDELPELNFGLMFHGFDYPDETGASGLTSRFWNCSMKQGVIEFPRPEDCQIKQFVREMDIKPFEKGKNLQAANDLEEQL